MKGSDKIDFGELSSQVTAWLSDFFSNLDTLELVAVGIVFLGLVMLIAGLFML